MKVKKVFEYEGIQLRIVEREEDYMNSPEKVVMVRVLAPNGGFIPVEIKRKQTLKSIAEETVRALNDYKMRGFDVAKGLTKEVKNEN